MKAVGALGILCLALAASTAYLVVRSSERVRSDGAQDCAARPVEHSTLSASRSNYQPATGIRVETRHGPRDAPAAPDTLLTGEAPARDINAAMEREVRALQRELLRNPDYRSARLELEKQHLWLAHRDAIDAIGLQPAIADALVQMLAERQLQAVEQPAEPSGVESDPKGKWVARERAAQRGVQSDVRNLLGDEKYREWLAFAETAHARREVSLLSREFEVGGDPLRDDQREALTKLIGEEQQRFTSEIESATANKNLEAGQGGESSSILMLEEQVKTIRKSNARLRDAARNYLSSQQLAVYEAVLERRLTLASAQLAVARESLQYRILFPGMSAPFSSPTG